MRKSLRIAAILVAGAPLLAFAVSANAEEWTRSTVHGGEISRSLTGQPGHYYGSTTRTASNGAIYTSNGECVSGVIGRCGHSYSAVGPDGATVMGKQGMAVGSRSIRTASGIAGPDGGRLLSVRRVAR